MLNSTINYYWSVSNPQNYFLTTSKKLTIHQKFIKNPGPKSSRFPNSISKALRKWALIKWWIYIDKDTPTPAAVFLGVDQPHWSHPHSPPRWGRTNWWLGPWGRFSHILPLRKRKPGNIINTWTCYILQFIFIFGY